MKEERDNRFMIRDALVPTLCVGMPSRTLRVLLRTALPSPKTTQSVEDGIPTQSVGTRLKQRNTKTYAAGWYVTTRAGWRARRVYACAPRLRFGLVCCISRGLASAGGLSEIGRRQTVYLIKHFDGLVIDGWLKIRYVFGKIYATNSHRAL